jgi:hypothetical protein
MKPAPHSPLSTVPRTPARRLLPQTQFVSLSEALTWIAFADALPAKELRKQVEGASDPVIGSPDERVRGAFALNEPSVRGSAGTGHFLDREPGLERLSKAWSCIRAGAEAGTLHLRGRYSSTFDPDDAELADVVKLSGSLLASFSQLDVTTAGIRRQPDGSKDVLWQDDPAGFERECLAFTDDPRAREGYLHVEVSRNEIIIGWPHPNSHKSTAIESVVAWCESWLSSGAGNGMDKAWEAFQAIPDHAGLSRDNVFRPAWNAAKCGKSLDK